MISADGTYTTEAPRETTTDDAERFLAELRRLAGFYEQGLLSDDEFAVAKQRLLARDEATIDVLWY